MDLYAEIARESTPVHARSIAAWIGGDRVRFGRLMEVFLQGPYRITQKASNIIGLCIAKDAQLLDPWIAEMLSVISVPGAEVSLRRNVLRILQDKDIPKRYQGRFADLCFTWLADAKEPVAIHVFAMTVIAQIAKKEPALMRGLSLRIREMLPHAGPGFRARARKILHPK